MNKPPLGVVPRKIHEENRIQDLSRAIYERSNYELSPIMLEWIDELKELVGKNVPLKSSKEWEKKFEKCADCGHVFTEIELYYHSDKVRCHRCHDAMTKNIGVMRK